MWPIDRHPRIAIAALGVLSVLIGYTAGGELFHGYAKSGGAYFLHGGVVALLLAGTMTALDRTSLRADLRGAGAAILALVTLYPLAVGFIWYDLVVTPPPFYGADPSMFGLAFDRLGFVLALAPLPAGYMLGAYASAPSDESSPAVPVLAATLVVGGPTAAYVVAVDGGAHPGFSSLFYGLLAFAGIVGSLPFYLVSRWKYADRKDAGCDPAVESPA